MVVLKEVVAKGWCVGCGMCAAVCPKNRLEMRWNDRGEYNPTERDGCAACNEKCNVCYSVCPAHGNTKNETEIGQQWYGDVEGIEYRAETGFHLASYLGYANRDHLRENGASGGMATWTLETLLESGEVDAVAAVGRTTNPEKFFEFRICNTVEEVRQCSRSAYYPVETSQIIRHILEHEGRYAIIGLPCVCKAIRLAQEKIPKLKKRIRYVLGLTCGHSCSRYFSEYLCALGHGNPYDMREIAFRRKDDPSQPASNHGMNFRTGEGTSERSGCVRMQHGMGFAYVNGYFQIRGCFYCDDVFAECADATFMDAWLPEYSVQTEGHSILIVRDLRLKERYDTAIDSGLAIKSLSIDQTIQSQQGVLERKRCQLAKCLIEYPKRRHDLIYHSRFHERRLKFLAYCCAEVSSRNWIPSNKDIVVFSDTMSQLRSRIIMLYKLKKCFNIPRALFRRISNLKNRPTKS